MSRHGYSSGSDALAGGLVSLALVVVVIAFFVIVRALAFIIHTFVRYPQVKGLWQSLAAAGALGLLAFLLSGVDPNLAAIVGIAAMLQLLFVCAVVRRKYAQTCIREDSDIVHAVLHTKWWSDEEQPYAA